MCFRKEGVFEVKQQIPAFNTKITNKYRKNKKLYTIPLTGREVERGLSLESHTKHKTKLNIQFTLKENRRVYLICISSIYLSGHVITCCAFCVCFSF